MSEYFITDFGKTLVSDSRDLRIPRFVAWIKDGPKGKGRPEVMDTNDHLQPFLTKYGPVDGVYRIGTTTIDGPAIVMKGYNNDDDPTTFVQALQRTWNNICADIIISQGGKELTPDEIRGVVVDRLETWFPEVAKALWDLTYVETQEVLKEAFPD